MQTGIVFDIEHYAVHDGPGIRTVVFFKGCPLRCAWCCNPESQRFAPELRRTMARCRGCLACVDACPIGAIESAAGEVVNGASASRCKDAPVFNRNACGACQAPCVDACAQSALAVSGERMTTDGVIERVAADKAFYRNSGGGVTFSGGEPFAQPAFLEELLARSKRLGIHTAVETCGLADPVVVAQCEPLIDLFLYDVKLADRERHERLTGVSNVSIVKNLRTLAERAPGKLAVRVPVIPGCTDDDENVEGIARLVLSVGLCDVELMPYHPLGVDKYGALGRDYVLEVDPASAPHAAQRAARIFSANGVTCRL